MHQLIVFASGTGTNAVAIHQYFATTGLARVALIVCNNPQAGVCGFAERAQIPLLLVKKGDLATEQFEAQIATHNPSLLVLAGFLLQIPPNLVRRFPQAIINLHPALLPAYGGKGMYGQHVHEAVLANGDRESGITVHRVNEHYDDGAILLQARCQVTPNDTPTTLAQKIHGLEHFYYPRAIHHCLTQLAGQVQV